MRSKLVTAMETKTDLWRGNILEMERIAYHESTLGSLPGQRKAWPLSMRDGVL